MYGGVGVVYKRQIHVRGCDLVCENRMSGQLWVIACVWIHVRDCDLVCESRMKGKVWVIVCVWIHVRGCEPVCIGFGLALALLCIGG